MYSLSQKLNSRLVAGRMQAAVAMTNGRCTSALCTLSKLVHFGMFPGLTTYGKKMMPSESHSAFSQWEWHERAVQRNTQTGFAHRETLDAHLIVT
jgi:hypothetical protein